MKRSPSSGVARRRLAAWSAVLAIGILVSLPASAQTGAALLREGNTLFRNGQYRDALERYRGASDAGLDTGVLRYNLGVTYYRLGEYAEAERWLERATREPALAQLAAYNLGLAHRASGDDDEAERWFNVASTSAGDAELRSLARLAATPRRGRVTRSEPRPARMTIPDRAEPPATELRVEATAAYGQVDNPNRTPETPYVDLSQPGRPLVTPEPASATFMPVNLLAEYVIHNEAGDSDFVFGYRMDGDFYSGSELAHSESTHELRLGADLDLGGRDGRSRRFDTALIAKSHDQRNFDLDTGLDRELEDVDLSKRFAYTSAGMEGEFGHTLGDWQWGFDLRAERREYDRNVIVENYDNERYHLGVSVAYQINDATQVSFGLRTDRILYDQRLSRDIDGALFSDYDPLEYDYQGIEIGAARTLFGTLTLELKYLTLDRTDVFDHYDDYTQDIVGLRAVYRPHRRFTLSVGATSRVYDYPNAFAFNVAAGGPKELEAMDTSLLAEFQVTRSLAVTVELADIEVTASDPRAEYARTQSVVGVVWRR